MQHFFRTALVPVLLSLLSMYGCASDAYRYKPAVDLTAGIGEREGVSYFVPSPQRPEGQVRIVSHGVVDFDTRNQPDIPMMHMRVSVHNESERDWALNTREQLLTLPDEGSSRPAYVNTDGPRNGLPRIVIRPEEKKAVDLYYPLPSGMNQEKLIPRFELDWAVVTGEQVVRNTTEFERYELSPQRVRINPYAPYMQASPLVPGAPGWGPVWWFDNDYSAWTWYHPAPVPPPAASVG